MTYEEAMILTLLGHAVRRITWHSPKQFVRYQGDLRGGTNWRSGCGRGSWYPKEEDLVAEDWWIDDMRYWNGWYYPHMRKMKEHVYFGLSNGYRWASLIKYGELYAKV